MNQLTINQDDQLARDLVEALTAVPLAYQTQSIANLIGTLRSWQDKTADHTLPVPHLWQAAEGARKYRNDCIHTCMGMVIRYLTAAAPTVDKLVEQSGKFNHAFGTVAQRHRLARLYNLRYTHYSQWAKAGKLDLETIKQNIDQQRPIVALILYSRIPKELRKRGRFSGWHAVVIAGYTADDEVIYNDPYQADGEGFRLKWGMFSEALKGDWRNIPYQGWAVYK